MKTLLPILKTKLFLLGFISACTVILATTVPLIRNLIAPEKAIGEKITTEQKKIAPKIKKQNKTVNAARVTSGLFLEMNNAFEASVETDLPDYSPGQYVTITGSGWTPGETVNLNLVSDCGCVNTMLYAVADEFGSISNSEFLLLDRHLGTSFTVIATGQTSSLVAETTFHDAITIWSNPISGNSPGLTSPYTTGDVIYPNANVTVSGITRGPGLTGDNANNRYSALAWNTGASLDVDDYFSFELTPNLGYHINFNNFIYTGQASGQGPTSFAFRSNLNSYSSDIGTPDANGETISLTASQFQNRTSATQFRFYGWSAGNGAGTYSINDFVFGGAVLGTSVTSLSSFSTCPNNPSSAQSFVVNGVGLTPNSTMTVTPSTNYELSITSAVAGFQGAGNVTFTADAVGAVSRTVWIRLKANPTSGTYSGEIINVSGGGFTLADDIDITVNGTVQGTIAAIAGTNDPVCPSSSNNFSGNATMSSYLWTLPTANGATISGSSTSQNVTVIAGSGCNTSYTLQLRVTDANSCTSTVSKTVTVQDNSVPTITAVGGTTLTLGCNPSAGDINAALGTATATDACGTPTVSSVDGSVSGACIKTQTRTFTAKDGCGNTSTTARTITWTDDVTPPVLTTGGTTLALGCNPSAGDINAALGTATATDACGTPTVSSVDGSVSGACIKTQTRTFTAIDGCGNTSTTARTITWTDDVTPPTLTAGGTTLALGCNPSAGDINAALGTATATDACGTPTVSSVDGSVSGACIKTQTRTFTAIDGCGNTSTTARTITWTDDVTPPTLTAGGTTLALGCNPSAGDINAALGTATATDACGTPTVSSVDGSVSGACIKTQTRTFTAIDGCGNTSTTARTITWTDDTTPPTLTAGGTTLTLGCNPSAGDINAALGTATATDACGTPTVSSVDGSVSGACIKTQTRTFTAKDGCGNTSTTARTITWTDDVTPPVLTAGGTTLALGCNPSAGDINAALGTATATDACGTPTVSSVDGSVSGACIKTQTRTFTAKDGCGNTSTTARTITWTDDVTPPVLTTGGTTLALGCNPSAGDINAALGTATATDACGTPTVSSVDGSVSGACIKTQTRTFTAKDGCGNTSTTARTITWTDDVTPPTLTAGGTTLALGCNPSAGDINAALGTATATDACGTPTVSSVDGSVSGACIKTQTRTFTAKDGCGNTSTTARTITWTDDVTPPVLTAGGTTLALGCNPSAGDINAALGTATATDACGTPTVSSVDGSVSGACIKTQTRTFTAKDGCGNTSTTARTITWTDDVTPPVLTTGGTTLALGCNPSAGDINAALGTATATDACGTPTVSSVDGSVSGACFKSQTRTFTAIDGCGNTSTTARTITWTDDVTPPVLTTGGTTLALGCNPSAGDINAALGTATATDACGTPTVSSVDGSVSGACIKTQTRTFTAKDGCGNTSTTARTITWTDDTTPPVLTAGGTTLALGCNPSAGDINAALGTATATDACGTPTVSSVDGSVSGACIKTQTRTFTAKDGCGNTSTTARTITWTDDVTPPVLTTGGTTLALGCNPSAGDINAALGTATATDACGTPTVSSVDGSVSGACFKSQTRTFTAIDGCGNTSTTARTITWTDDVTPPVLTAGGTTLALGCNPSAGDINAALGTATATDACGTPTVSSVDGSVSGACIKTQTRTFTAIDGCGNTSTTARTITWTDDTTPPTLTAGGTTLALGCNPAASDINAALGTATATDACGTPTVSSVDGSVSGACIKTQTRTFTAKDGCGNTSTTARTITWTDDVTPPVLTTGGTTLALGCNPSAGDINAALGTATATDACGTPTVSSVDGSVSGACIKTQTRTFTAKDGCGNTSTTARTITWTDDVTPPTLTAGGTTLALGCNPAASDINAALGTATATDACGVPTVSSSDGSVVNTGCVRTQTRTFTAIDGCNNTSTVARTVSWTDDITPPSITCPATQDLNLGAACTALVPNYVSLASATDACGTPTITQVSPSVGSTVSNVGTFTVVLKATDACNNTSTCSFIVNKKDVTAPVISVCANDQNINLNANCKVSVPTLLITVSDNCGAFVSQSPAAGTLLSSSHNQTHVVVITATDAGGNTATCSVTLTGKDITAPTVSAGSNQSANTSADGTGDCDTDLAIADATFGDNCTASLSWIMTGVTSDNGTGQVATHNFNKGVTTIKYTATDGAGLTATSSKTVTISDNEVPNAICKNATIQLNAAGNATLNNSQVDNGSNDNCGSVTLSLSKTAFNCSDVGANTVKLTVTDASGNTSTCSSTVTVEDKVAPVANCQNVSVLLGMSGSVTVTGAQVNNGSTDACGGLTYSLAPNTFTAAGDYGVVLTVTDVNGNTASCSATVTVGKRPTTLTYTGDNTEQYSDLQTLTAYLKDNTTNSGISSKTIVFTIGTQSIEAVTNTAGIATVTLKLHQPPTSATAGISYTVATSFAGDNIYQPASDNDLFTITKENAIVDYTGQSFINSPAALTNVLMTAAIKDDVDGYPGNISKAKVKFVIRDYNSLAIVHQSGWLNVSLPNPTDTLNGLGVYEWVNAPVPANVGDQDQYNVEVLVDCDPGSGIGNYKGYDIAALSIFRTATIDFITGGGYIRPTNSLGSYKADNGRKMNFGFNIKWNKSFKNLIGKLNVIYRVGTKIYQVKTNATSSLTINSSNPCSKTATFTAKANLTDVTDPLAPVQVLSGLNLQLKLTDNGEPGNTDKWGLTLYDGTTLVLASEWGSGQLQELVLGGGNIVVHSGPDCPNGSRIDNSLTNKNAEMEVVPDVFAFNVKVFPNPSEHQFSLVLVGATNEKVQIVVYDMLGRQVKMFEKPSANIPIRFGMDLKVGTYVVEVRQGENRKTLKVIKQ